MVASIDQTLQTDADLRVRAEAHHVGQLYEIGAYTADIAQDCEGRFRSDWHYLQMSIRDDPPIFSQFVPQATSQWHRNGRCVFVPARQTVDCRICAGSRTMLSCLIDPALLKDEEGRDVPWNSLPPDRAADVVSPCLHLILQRIFDELLRPSFAGSFYIETAVAFLGAEIVRCLDPAARKQSHRSGTLTTKQMALLRERIEATGERPPTLLELAELVSLSPGVLSERFQRSTARTLRTYVAEKKLEKARALLTKRGLMMKQVAYLSGFKSAAAFATAFRREFGLTPSQFQAGIPD
ncbi:AraC-like DNA-binding protein [Sphingobium fontiphilum]|uniref:AraC-like DNA-binding protein n=1 Tax=Sphingobium fontiphilum TaxID=944425 RepID=A0A7W6DGS0_9SPHN|nr:AraC family transcriptional regulator [Sphingobium fontiphilum]MBB3982299.1 AraC-like DNA-binding protein [Sphingobium fontiphilum]